MPEHLVQRVVIEHVVPEVDAGRFPIKRTPGETVVVRAVIHADGHDVVDAVLRYRHIAASRRGDEAPWQETPMIPLGNDAWTATFRVGDEIGEAEYTIEGWIDVFATWRRGLAAKVGAGQDVSSELLEGALLLRDAATRSPHAERLRGVADRLEGGAPMADRAQAGLDPAIEELASAAADRTRATRCARVLKVLVDRERARFGCVVRAVPALAGTRPDAQRRPSRSRVAGCLRSRRWASTSCTCRPSTRSGARTARAGTTRLDAAPGDVGQPVGHRRPRGRPRRVEPGLGTLEDFERFLAAVARARHGDRAGPRLQCSPDHPYVTEHPEWFRHSPDGTIKYAENPPKKYQDIYPISTSRRRSRRAAGALARVEAGLRSSGSNAACGSSGSTTRTPSRSPSGRG
jgi:starch synthase (maltosyl-transferring)